MNRVCRIAGLLLCCLWGRAAEPVRHWAFQPIVRPALPGVGWRNPLDAFVQERLAREGLRPAAEADRVTLIRRACLDLTGLPPTPEQAAAFQADRNPLAYEHLVDSLLGSPRFGERQARHWLDVVRFAETHGFEMNNPRGTAWRYRDYVIRAFNEDKPFDQFVREQLAGDALGEDVATGFLVAGAWDQVKSPDEVLTKNQRADELHDMVSVTGSAFLGLTTGCARCHDHKFDPIPMTDYYALKAVFEGVQHGERELTTAEDAGRARQAAEMRERLRQIGTALIEFEPVVQVGAVDTNRLRAPVNARLNLERISPIVAKRLRFTINATSGAEPCLDELEVFNAGGTNVALASLGTKASASGTYPNSDIHRLEHINDGRFGNGRSWISNEQGKGWVELDFGQPYEIERIAWARDREERYADRLVTDYRIEVAGEEGGWHTVASSADRKPYRADQPATGDYLTNGLSAGSLTRLARLLDERKRLTAQVRDLTSRPMIYAGRFQAPEATRRLHRGDPMQPREEIAPGTLTRIGFRAEPTPDKTEGDKLTVEQHRRLVLADWIASAQNPLTARVIVNRVWQAHFGEGLVSTPSDFGVNGARPTHPELLDWLAAELIEHGWSLKHIHRLIVTSATYRQDGRGEMKEAAAKDGGNRLLWHFPARRLEAEPIRDAMLAVAGRLDLRAGGPGWSPFVPNENYVRVYVPKERFEPEDFRRMIYAMVVRQRPEGVFGVFDCPDGGQVAPKRGRSTTPLQALNLLNSGFVMQVAELFAQRLEADCGRNADAQVRRAFELAFNREPSLAELGASVKFIGDQGLPLFCRALYNASEFVFLP